MLLPELAEAAAELKPGEVAEPLLIHGPTGNDALLVIQLAPERPVIPFEDVKEQMRERAIAEATDLQRKQWLQELRRHAYIETRL
jgi:hypothetical protein